MNNKINIPNDINIALRTLESYNKLAYIVGGCVRDSIIGIEPHDWDICTSALPEDVISIFSDKYKVIETGVKHGTVTVVINGEHIEITTFRKDGEYTDGRHPDMVEYTNDLIVDLSRRDFTINSIAYNHNEGLIDPFNGQEDIENKTIKCVGNPKHRFNEDALRMLRCIRFACRFDFKIDLYTQYTLMTHSHLIKNVSQERITSEFNQILLNDNYIVGFKYLTITKLLQYILPELDNCRKVKQHNPYHIYTVFAHQLHSVQYIEPILHLRLTMLLHDIAKPMCKTIDENGMGHFYKHNIIGSDLVEEILIRLKYDSDTINKVKILVLYHDCAIPTNTKSIKRWLNKIGLDMFRDLILVKYADMYAQSWLAYEEKRDNLVKLEMMLEEVLNAKECFSRKDLAINGKDLIELGFKQGKQLGDILDGLLEYVIDYPESNNKETLINKVLLQYS